MKFAICNENFQDWPLDRACDFAAECGYRGIEIAPFTLAQRAGDVSPRQRIEISRAVRAAGLEVVGLHWLLAKTDGFHITSRMLRSENARPITSSSLRNCAATSAAG